MASLHGALQSQCDLPHDGHSHFGGCRHVQVYPGGRKFKSALGKNASGYREADNNVACQCGQGAEKSNKPATAILPLPERTSSSIKANNDTERIFREIGRCTWVAIASIDRHSAFITCAPGLRNIAESK
jgi:hypothetical protein